MMSNNARSALTNPNLMLSSEQFACSNILPKLLYFWQFYNGPRLEICRDPGTGGPVKFFLTV